MWKVVLLVSMLWSASDALAEKGAMIVDLDASEVIREGQILAVEREGDDWHLLVNYNDTLYACDTYAGYGGASSMGLWCKTLPYMQ